MRGGFTTENTEFTEVKSGFRYNGLVLCKNCHYSLTGLSEHRCPECAYPFDPNDPSTYEKETLLEPGPVFTRTLWGAVGAFVGVFGSLVGVSGINGKYQPIHTQIAYMVGIALVGAVVTAPVIFVLATGIGLIKRRRKS